MIGREWFSSYLKGRKQLVKITSRNLLTRISFQNSTWIFFTDIIGLLSIGEKEKSFAMLVNWEISTKTFHVCKKSK